MILKCVCFFFSACFQLCDLQDKFKEAPVLFSHLRTGKEYDSALLRTEDVTKSSAKICRHKLRNFDGKHEDINAVYVYFLTKCNYSCFEL